MIEPEHLLAYSMFSLIALGLVAQLMQQQGGKTARATPYVTVALLIVIVTFGVVMLQYSILMSQGLWTEATSNNSLRRRDRYAGDIQ